MMMNALINGLIFTGEKFVEGQAVLLAGSKIEAIIPASQIPETASRYDLCGARLLPGFIDIQVNGGNGRLFNDAPTVETICHIGDSHRRFGTTGFLPTLISDGIDVIEKAISAVDDAMNQRVPGLLGIHIEGPFLSIDRKGVHDPSKFRALTREHIRLLTSLTNGITLLTIAPEKTTPEIIRELTDSGVIVSIGHTDATYEVTRTALDSGVSGFTHLFNAMSPLTGREPGVVGAALDDMESWCGIIVDGRHVAPATLRIALRAKPHEKFILVTDAMPSVGMESTSFDLQGRRINVTNGVCIAENGTLAGSNLDMASAVRNAVSLLGLDFEDAVNMATRSPAKFLGLEHSVGRIAVGYQANLVAVDGNLNVLESWINGKLSALFSKESHHESDQPASAS